MPPPTAYLSLTMFEARCVPHFAESTAEKAEKRTSLFRMYGCAVGGTVEQSVSNRIDFLARITGATNAQLARALSFAEAHKR